MVALPALVSGLDAELVRLGYKDSTMVWYRGCWRRLQKYFAACGAEEFSLDVGEGVGRPGLRRLFRRKEQGRRPWKPNGTSTCSGSPRCSASTRRTGRVLRRYNRSVSKLDGPGAEAVARFQAAPARGWALGIDGARTYGTLAGEFVAFTGTRGGLAYCEAPT